MQQQKLKWTKAKASTQVGACVEISESMDGFYIRNSRFPEDLLPAFTQEEIDAFIKGAKDGDFDQFVSETVEA